jgi:hypothetical protein
MNLTKTRSAYAAIMAAIGSCYDLCGEFRRDWREQVECCRLPQDAETGAMVLRDQYVRRGGERAEGLYAGLKKRISTLDGRCRTAAKAVRTQLIEVEVALNEERYADAIRTTTRIHKEVDGEFQRLGALPQRPKSAYGKRNLPTTKSAVKATRK